MMEIDRPERELKEERIGDGDEDDDKQTVEVVEEPHEQALILKVAEWKFALTLPDSVVAPKEKEEAKKKIMEEITKNNMAPFYRHMCKTFNWPEDSKLFEKMAADNEKELKELRAKREVAEKTAGETEVRDAEAAISDFYARIGEKKLATTGYEDDLKKAVGAGARIDVVFKLLRLAMAWNDIPAIRANIAKCKGLVEKGGDWDRRNRLAVYEATYLILTREFKEAAKLFMDATATFSCYELYPYERFVFYTVVSAVVSQGRVTLRDKVVKSPEILGSLDDVANLRSFLFSLYRCEYRNFFNSLVSISDQLARDQYFSGHLAYFMREIRIVAYTQFLTSYKSVTLASMANLFGVTLPFLDRELSRFIAAGRINAKIDAVSGIVETNRPDAKNTQYANTIKQGDLLLNRIQKLTKVISY